MPWRCYVVELVPDSGNIFRRDGKVVSWSDLEPGAMWFEDDDLWVKIPGGRDGSGWNVDRGRKLNEQLGEHKYPQWTRKGEPPNVTATPSINYVGFYHGNLIDGILTDDCEGRKFDA